ncbi:D-alanyl-D-alanine carboxypeptidase/D-alanyl-D-alanine-endopeptidase [Roseovarius mucosus]|uniref:D-alanyl-D-alanine carboxypeptidase/D-alanyl-D-alanine endopeptidase n=1 Tax=Roseovarius mucosus TaxID=215743 RepID=UPI001C5CCD25|nr:D-alanyl-D-alanine carboxypeptidase/D-alanyl-D-alanine-endopeptidase [Roseovarius mucosus]MBW4974334.1 D-alanyl-D-alanine carboxypeptidase/D-alanyl-D-alanine-endopeptidase [Roseovarius mucosus]
MSTGISRRYFLGTALAALGSSAMAGAPAVSLRPVARPDGGARRAVQRAPAAEALISQANLSGRVGYAVADARTGQLLESGDATTGLPPASVTKAVTALYALDALGPEHRFGTRLIATGPISGGVLNGDLILAGGGDPTLETDGLASLAANLAKTGLREVRGRLLVWGGAVPFTRAIDETQPEHAGYNPALSGLNLNYNRVHFEWRRANGKYAITMDARSDRYRPDVTMARMRIVDRNVPVYSYKDAGSYDDWTVALGALGTGGARWLPVRKPELYAGEVFATFARSQGIKTGAPQVIDRLPGGTAIVTHASAPLATILRDMLKFSTNLTAEMVGLAASAKRRGAVVALDQSAQDMNAWAAPALGMTGAALRDHSGLSDRSRLSAAAMAQALARAHRAGLLRPLLRTVELRDAQGRPNRNHPLKVAAKTGTLHFVSALAGYVTTPQGADLAFAIFTASDSLRARIDPSQDDSPPGARSWNSRSKQLQQALIERWGAVYGG